MICLGDFVELETILNKGANINHTSVRGNISLIWAARNGHLECVKYLLDNGVKINHQNNCGYTALMIASENGNLKCVEYLLYKGANIYLCNKYNDTALTVKYCIKLDKLPPIYAYLSESLKKITV